MNIRKPIACELYEIRTEGGEKYIHILAYTYQSDVDWRLIEGTWIIVKLKNFIMCFAEHKEDFTNEMWEETNQYESEMRGEELVDAVNNYFAGRGADKFLQYGEITIDTPDGNYIHKS